DLSRDQNAPSRPALELVQADGRQDLELSASLNQGDPGDPFPGSERVMLVGDTGLVSTTFPGRARSGITLSNIAVDPQSGAIRVNIAIQSPSPTPPTPSVVTGTREGVIPRDARPPAPLPEVGSVPAEPRQPVVAGLENVLRQPRVSAAELA